MYLPGALGTHTQLAHCAAPQQAASQSAALAMGVDE